MHFGFLRQDSGQVVQRKQKGSVQLLLLAAVVAIILGGVFFYFNLKTTKKEVILQSPKITSPKQPEFKVYSDSVLGFSFQYPLNLNAKTDSEEEFNKRGNGDFRKNFKGYVGYEPGKVLGAAVVLDNTNSFGTNPFSVWIFNNDNNLTIEQWFKDYWYYPYLWGVFDYTSKSHITLDTEATISGIPAKSKIVSYQPGKPKFIYAAKDQKMYLFRVIGDTGDEILSTFKFN